MSTATPSSAPATHSGARVFSAPALYVLVADDDPTSQIIVQRQLEKLGCNVDLASDGEEAFALWQENRHPVVLTDISMPRLDGAGLTARIRIMEEGTGARTRIIALTASGAGADRKTCLEAGMDDHLNKPVTQAQLKRALGL